MTREEPAMDPSEEVPNFQIVDNIIIGKKLVFPEASLNAGDTILETLKSRPDFVGQIEASTGRKSTYGEMRERSVKCAIWMRRQGVQPRDVVGVCSDNHLDAYVPFLASLYIGAVFAPGDPDQTAFSSRYYLSLTSPSLVFVHDYSKAVMTSAAEALNMKIKWVLFEKDSSNDVCLDEILAEQDAADVEKFACAKIENSRETALIVSTSGTTGLPKGAELSHLAVRTYMHPEHCSYFANCFSLWASTLRWNYGIAKSFKALAAFSTRIIVPDDDDTRFIVKTIEKYRVECLATEPTVMLELFKSGMLKTRSLSSLKRIIVGGSPMKKELHEVYAKCLPRVDIVQIYGSTDCGNAVVGQIKNGRYNGFGSCGYLRSGVRLKIFDQTTGSSLGPNERGEICVKATSTLNRYRDNPEATKRAIDLDGWLHTGDIGYYNENGEIYVVDRISDFINFRGTSISSAEIEVVLETHPAVLKAAVIPYPDEIDVEVPFGAVVKAPNKKVTEKELVEFCRKNIPDYCELRGVKFIDKFPRTSTGKIAKKELKRLLGIC